MTRTNFHLDDAQIIRLRNLAQAEGVSVAELVRKAIDSHLESKVPRDGMLIHYKEYVGVVRLNAEANCLEINAQGPFGVGMRLQADSFKDAKELFKWSIDRWLKFCDSEKEQG